MTAMTLNNQKSANGQIETRVQRTCDDGFIVRVYREGQERAAANREFWDVNQAIAYARQCCGR